MSSSAFFEKQNSARRDIGVSRLIPGASVMRRIVKKRPQADAVDPERWLAGTPERASGPQSWRLLRAIAEAVLPQPQSQIGLFTLWGSVSTDFVLLFMGFIAASQTRFGLRLFFGLSVDPARSVALPFSRGYLGLVLVYGALVTLLGYVEGLYSADPDRSTQAQVVVLGKAICWPTVLIGAAIRISSIDSISLGILGWTAAFDFAGLMAWRVCKRSRSARRVETGRSVRNVLIVGAGSLGRELGDYFEKNPETGFVVKGYLDDSLALSPIVLGRTNDLDRVARAKFVDEVILTVPGDREQARRVIQRARWNHLDVKVIPDLFGCELPHLGFEHIGRIPVISLHHEPLPAFGLFLKRVLDVLVGAIALVLAIPLMAAIALLIRFDSPGPLTYIASRVGKKGRRFRCYKFRTMVTNADQIKDSLRALNQRQGPCFKIAEDPRITRVGRFLRHYSLDELPQLWNVLKGDMSLVGPRPHPVDDYARYELEHLRRLDMTPGITGLWQVTAREDPSFRANMALDVEYIEKWSLWLDLKILIKTLSVVVEGNGA